MSKKLVRIIFHPLNKVVEVERGTLLLDAIREAGIQIESICGGKGQCGKCRVILNKGEVSIASEDIYKKHFSPQEISQNYHLACQVYVLSDSEFTIPVESRIDKPKILVSTEMRIEELDPASRKYLVKVSRSPDFLLPSIKLENYSGLRPKIDNETYRKILSLSEPITVTVSTTSGYPEVIKVEPGDKVGTNYGLAIDIGTTTVVMLLVDLTNGKIIDKDSTLNRQITYGEELITRIAFASQPEGLQKLQRAVTESINHLIERITARTGIKKEEITDICAGGNTVMNHLLVGMDPTYLEMANVEVSRKPIIRKAKEIGIDVNPDTYVYCLPNVSRFVGGDAVGDVLVSGMHKSEDLSLLIDLGTNGEIILGNKDWLASVSCASGPAFEGAGIKFGMRAMRGAIEHVKINPETFEAECQVIGNTLPKGICGSGIIDAVAEMFSVGILDFSGKIVEGKTPLVRRGSEGLEYVLVPAEKTAIGRDIVITQQDMAYIMDSKGAACGAIGVLMKKYKVSIYDIKHIYLAGAFGSYTDLRNVIKFGIIPEFPNGKFHPLGNGSLSGAYATLLSLKKREEAREIAEKMVYIDLLVDVDFNEEYSAAIYIPGKREFFPSYYSSRAITT